MSTDEFRCICDPNDLFDPPDPRPRAVAGCPAHRARRAAQQFAEQHDVQVGTLHERLLAELDPTAVWAPLPTSDSGRRSAALRAVVELHAPRPCNCREAKHVICAGCPGHAVVCATRLAIAEALGIGETPK